MAGIIAAALATPLLLLLYFLKLRRRPVRISSTLLWERAVRDLQVNAPFRWLRWSFLLVLQLLALGAFCMALARPAIDAAAAPAGRQIILIDTSASMSARDGGDGATRLTVAKEQALELIDRLDETLTEAGVVEAAVIAFAASPRALTGFTSARNELRRAVEQIRPTDQPADFGAAMKLAQAMAQQGRADDIAARIVLFSDGALDAEETSTGDAEFHLVRIGPEAGAVRDNLGVAAIAARRDLDDPALVRIFARVVNASTNEVTTPLTLRVDDALVASRELRAPGRTDEGPGEAAVTFDYTDTPTGRPKLATVAIMRTDLLPNDNIAAVRLDPVIPPRVLIVAPDRMDEAQSLAHELLSQAIRAIGSNIVDTINRAAYEQAAGAPDTLRQYDLIIFNGVNVTWLPPAATMSFGGRLTRGDGATAVPDEGGGAVRFASWRRSHPILRQVNLDSVVIARRGGHMIPPDTDGRLVTEELAYGDRGPLVLLHRDGAVSRLSVGFELAQSNWPVNVSFVVFLTNAIEQLTRLIGETTGVAYTTSEPVTVRAAPGAARIEVRGPTSFSVEAAPDVANVNLGVLPLAGVHQISGVVESDALLPVNLQSASESAIETRDSLRIAGRAADAGTLESGTPREVWRWFVLAGLAILTIEWLLYAWRMRV